MKINISYSIIGLIRNIIYTSIIKLTMILLLSPIISQSFSQTASNEQIKFLGNIISHDIPGDFTKYWDQVTPENSGKWANVEADEGEFNWTELDMAYNFAIKNGIPFKFHNLVWGKQQPSWLRNLDSAKQTAAVEEWIKLAGERYPKTTLVDVVNEPIRTPYDTVYPPYYKAIGDEGKTGWDWVIWSFEKARKYFPNAKLILNEYNILNGQKPIKTFVQIIKLLKERNLIDGIGCQGHFLEKTDTAYIRSKLDILAALDLPIYISEYDVDNADDAKQLEIYKEQIPLLWNYPLIKGITLWGYQQDKIWRRDAYLVRSDGSERPAIQWLEEYIKNNK